MLSDTRPLWLFVLFGLAPFFIGCDSLSDADSPSPRDRLVGTWVIEGQTETYQVVTNADQTVLDPDAEATGTMTLRGRWLYEGRYRAVD